MKNRKILEDAIEILEIVLGAILFSIIFTALFVLVKVCKS